MPDINRIRVNNVKYNFDTQYYDDFTMRMYGKNTLYDLANGGGKSVLMLLLMQNLIPNCTLDDKQPIEKLFRTGSGNTTIHSLIEWRLDDCDVKEGYRYMTTGFCARKAKDSDDADRKERGLDTAEIEYFNYCIFYRKYNKNDIINLPLIKDGERISYQALRNYLKDLEHKNMDLVVRVFDRKGEYQRFISSYGLHESQWEIIRGINKTEGHVRTYFETNYKTTRKVVEDLLIEGIIEKAFLVKTERDAEENGKNDTMARLLMDIKDQLMELTSRKKDIVSYEHQIELINLLADRIGSFTDTYEAERQLVKKLADIYVTGERFQKESDNTCELLMKEMKVKKENKEVLARKLENLKVAADRRLLLEMKREIESLADSERIAKEKVTEAGYELSLKEAITEYAEYLDEKAKYDYYDELSKKHEEADADEESFRMIVHNLKLIFDEEIRTLGEKLSEMIDEREKKEGIFLTDKKLLKETELLLAKAENGVIISEENIRSLSVKLSTLTKEMSDYTIGDVKDKLSENDRERKALSEKLDSTDGVLKEKAAILKSEEEEGAMLSRKLESLLGEEKRLSLAAEKFESSRSKLDKICEIYGVKVQNGEDYSELLKNIRARMNSAIIEEDRIKKALRELDKHTKRVESGILIEEASGVTKVIEYIRSRHGIYAMNGMDYVSALPDDAKREVLSKNPLLPYGVVTKDFQKIKEDPNIRDVDTGSETVFVYDYDNLDIENENENINSLSIVKKADYFINPDNAKKLIMFDDEKIRELSEKLAAIKEMMISYEDDESFVIIAGDKEKAGAKEALRKITIDIADVRNKLSESTRRIKNLNDEISGLKVIFEETKKALEIKNADYMLLQRISEITDIISENEKMLTDSRNEIDRLQRKERELSKAVLDEEIYLKEREEGVAALRTELEALMKLWKEKYAEYYVEGEYMQLGLSKEALIADFDHYSGKYSNLSHEKQERQLLMQTLSNSMDRIIKSIQKKGISVESLNELEKEGGIIAVSSDLLLKIKENLSNATRDYEVVTAKIREKQKETSKLEGRIEYAIKNIEAAFGSYDDSYEKLLDVAKEIKVTTELLSRARAEADRSAEKYAEYTKSESGMKDLFKDCRRIVERNDIDTQDAVCYDIEYDDLRELFEDTITGYDRIQKKLDKIKAEALRFKDQTASTLREMGCFELSETIRNDVSVPKNFEEAVELLKNLNSITGYISLERDRVSKSLVDMELLKKNFEEQCLQRCLDVKTELDKLPKLSNIILEGENIQMVGLKIPYVKEEFMRQRMSDYIDKIVEHADGIADDSERIKYIKNCLALKKMFGVIVNDMNQIKLSLYKRERIKEQSRYLKYEEAVGSTGQSQGIYIQFLVSIINYISGMYSRRTDEVRLKTIFIDNPFGAAKDVYIWEPIFELLKMNNVQLIVPARGATPAITGRFDVNYVLGQVLTGKRQVTVVVNYNSKTDNEELEYHELSFEQTTFDFI